MSKGNYTHVQELFPEIKAMLASGKTQREVAEYFGFRDKYVVKKLVKRERAKQRKQEAGIEIRPKGRPRKDAGPRDIVTEQAYMLAQEILSQSRHTRSIVCVWKMSYCGIFCDPQEGSESKGKVCSHLPSP